MGDIERLIEGRRAEGRLRLADWQSYWAAALPRLVDLAHNEGIPPNTMRWMRRHLPELLREPWCTAQWFEVEEARIIGINNAFARAKQIARELRVIEYEYKAYGLGPLTWRTTRAQKRDKRVRNKATKGRARTAKGSLPHDSSMARSKPWDALGISESTYRRRGLHRDHPGSRAQRSARRCAAETEASSEPTASM